ncbi:MAG: hypothetical protein RBT75_12070 [Anaerolineae bacterium]|jgi:hypothetical protein|nr:hypothetical protein [Anaerolineae bacterium]
MAKAVCAQQRISLAKLQPSQLYISAEKLAAVESQWQPSLLETLDPIPVKELDGRIIYTDGHTRAFAALRQGFTEVPVIWNEDALDWDAYRICVTWCQNEGITTIMDLATRILPHEDYEILWHGRCRTMQEALALQRREEERTR